MDRIEELGGLEIDKVRDGMEVCCWALSPEGAVVVRGKTERERMHLGTHSVGLCLSV